MRIVLLICAITPKCPEVARILSQGMDRRLPLATRIKLRIHYLMCAFCERYAKQLQYIRKTSGAFAGHADDASGEVLPVEAKMRFKQSLREEAGLSEPPADGRCCSS